MCTVGIQGESDQDLGLTTLGALDTIDGEVTEKMVIHGLGALTFKNAAVELLLVVSGGGIPKLQNTKN